MTRQMTTGGYQRPANSRVQHGQAACADYGCRRTECLDARRAKQKLNGYLARTGRPGQVPPDRAIAWVRTLRHAGRDDSEIIALAGIGRNTLYKTLRGNTPIMRTTERRILSVPLPDQPLTAQPFALEDSVGSRRRLQALVAKGFPLTFLAHKLDRVPSRVERILAGQQVRIYTAQQISALYDQWWDKQPEDHGIQPEDAEWTRIIAETRGYQPPHAWDDIDDPAAEPDVTGYCGTITGYYKHRLAGLPMCVRCQTAPDQWEAERSHLTPAERGRLLRAERAAAAGRSKALAEDWRELEKQGYTIELAAQRLGVTRSALEKALSRTSSEAALEKALSETYTEAA